MQIIKGKKKNGQHASLLFLQLCVQSLCTPPWWYPSFGNMAWWLLSLQWWLFPEFVISVIKQWWNIKSVCLFGFFFLMLPILPYWCTIPSVLYTYLLLLGTVCMSSAVRWGLCGWRWLCYIGCVGKMSLWHCSLAWRRLHRTFSWHTCNHLFKQMNKIMPISL